MHVFIKETKQHILCFLFSVSFEDIFGHSQLVFVVVVFCFICFFAVVVLGVDVIFVVVLLP